MKDYILKNGLVLGAVYIVLSSIAYSIGVSFTLSTSWSIIQFVVPIAILIYMLVFYKKMMGGFINFNHSFILVFGLIASSSFIHMVFNIILYNYIDPNFSILLQEATIEKSIELMQGFASESAMEEMITTLENQDSFSPRSLASAFGYGLVLNAILSLIIAAFFKKDAPIENLD